MTNFIELPFLLRFFKQLPFIKAYKKIGSIYKNHIKTKSPTCLSKALKNTKMNICYDKSLQVFFNFINSCDATTAVTFVPDNSYSCSILKIS